MTTPLANITPAQILAATDDQLNAWDAQYADASTDTRQSLDDRTRYNDLLIAIGAELDARSGVPVPAQAPAGVIRRPSNPPAPAPAPATQPQKTGRANAGSGRAGNVPAATRPLLLLLHL